MPMLVQEESCSQSPDPEEPVMVRLLSLDQVLGVEYGEASFFTVHRPFLCHIREAVTFGVWPSSHFQKLW